MSKQNEKKIDQLQAEYKNRFGEFWPGIGIPLEDHQEWIERCLRLNKTQDQLDRATGIPSDAIL
jgi:hypothetical protein